MELQCLCQARRASGQVFSCHYTQEHPISWENWVAHNLAFKHSKRERKRLAFPPACTKPCPSSCKDLKCLILAVFNEFQRSCTLHTQNWQQSRASEDRWPGWCYCSDNFKHSTHRAAKEATTTRCMDQECKTEALSLREMNICKKMAWKLVLWVKLSPNESGKFHLSQSRVRHPTHGNQKTRQGLATLSEHAGNRSEDVITPKLPAVARMYCIQLCWRNAAKAQDRRCKKQSYNFVYIDVFCSAFNTITLYHLCNSRNKWEDFPLDLQTHFLLGLKTGKKIWWAPESMNSVSAGPVSITTTWGNIIYMIKCRKNKTK